MMQPIQQCFISMHKRQLSLRNLALNSFVNLCMIMMQRNALQQKQSVCHDIDVTRLAMCCRCALCIRNCRDSRYIFWHINNMCEPMAIAAQRSDA